MSLTKISLAAITLLLSTASYANLTIRFIESAPKDIFVIENTSACALSAFTVDINLSNSAGNLIFDTTEVGAGVEVFQPFEVRSGEITLAGEQAVNDGNNQLSVRIERLAPNESASFTIDVDDQLSNSELGQIRVSGSEIQGASARVLINNSGSFMGVFDKRSNLSISLPNCV